MKRRYPHKQRILLVNITRLGDMLQATPTISGMKMENPDCHITVLVEKQFEAVCHLIPGVDEVMSLDLGMTVRSIAREGEGLIDAFEYLGEFVDKLKAKNFDYVLNMSSSAYTALLLNLLEIDRRGGWSSDAEGHRVIESDWARLFATSVFHQNRQYNSLNLVDVFRCSADVLEHPYHLVINVADEDKAYCEKFISEANFTNTGPLVVVQAGASQGKRQWMPRNFIEFIKILTEQHEARIVLSGTKKELEIINPIVEGCASPNVAVAAGKTNIPQLAALLQMSELLVTGDTGPMHMSVAVGTPVVSMFLASAFGFETGPYSEGNIVLQPVIECGPCNPNKPCARPDCHDTIDPKLIAELVGLRLKGDVRELPESLGSMIDPAKILVYRTYFDEHGFYDMEALNTRGGEELKRYRDAYRNLWLDDIAGLVEASQFQTRGGNKLSMLGDGLEGIEQIIECAQQGRRLIEELEKAIRDVHAPPARLGELSEALSEVDRQIESYGYHYPYLGPLARMFVFSKENLSGSEALSLASQMGGVYQDLKRRGEKLSHYYNLV